MSHLNTYNEWLKNVKNKDLKAELLTLKENDLELQNRFGSILKFGTSGLRGIMGVGTSFINEYTVAQTTQGIATYLKENFKRASVVISYDNRKNSQVYAHQTADILASNGVKVYIFKRLTPTPILSYFVRKLKATLGINITSSHNSKEYNGYKVVNSVGAQISTDQANEIVKYISKTPMFGNLTSNFKKLVKAGKINFISDEDSFEYISQNLKYLPKQKLNYDSVSVVYTPLHGTGYPFMMEAFKLLGVKKVFSPENQIQPNENFPTTPYPNPELDSVFTEGLKVAKKVNANVIFASDPDCDRVGVMVKHGKEFVKLTGDQVGVIMLYYLLDQLKAQEKLTKNTFFVTSVVSSIMSERVANEFKVKTFKTLTGFKHIGNKVEEIINKLNEKSDVKNYGEKNFVLGYEESIGYMVTHTIRDKDGIMPTLLLTQIVALLQKEGKTLVDYLNEIYEKVGYVFNDNYSFEFAGFGGLEKITNAVEKLRANTPTKFGKRKVVNVIDYLKTKQTKLEAQNFIEIVLDDESKVIVRPSGTEPKLKIYTTVIKGSEKQSVKALKDLKKRVKKLLFSK